MKGEQYRHIFLPGPTRTADFTSPRRGGGESDIPERERADHSAYLISRFEEAWRNAEQQRAVSHVTRRGVYVDFCGEPGYDLALKSLDAIGSGVRLLNTRVTGEGDAEQTLATVYIPNAKRNHFLRKFSKYAEEVDGRSGKPKNRLLVDSIADIQLSVLTSFWQDNRSLLPGDQPEWVEVWLSSDDEATIESFRHLLVEMQLESKEGELRFPERVVLLVSANRNQLAVLIGKSDDIAELRRGKEVATFFVEMENEEQVEMGQALLQRCDTESTDGVAVCILDHGVNRGHLLLQPVLTDADMHAVYPSWGTSDDDGHGTLMAGIAAYGNLLELLNSHAQFALTHRLESAKILPPPPATTSKELWGYMTAQGLYRAEIQAPDRKRVACMAITSIDDRDQGRPSSWSGAVDNLTSGSEDGIRRLFIVSAGNVDAPANWKNYPHDNLTNEVHDPGQAWNALTVGAFTEKIQIQTPYLHGYQAIAPVGGLSPYSTTSLSWLARKWPIKPEVLFEGGNVAQGPNDSIFDTDDLKLVSTYHDPQVAQFGPFCATSAATAQAAWMAARIHAAYPEAWPETVRALLVHTAEWTDMMKCQFLPLNPAKGDYARLLRICGYGVPDLDRALYCATDSLTLVSQAELQPYGKRDDRYVMKDMHLYELPWPTQVLLDLGQMPVKMRVTLSYFVEPGPGEVGWEDRYRYASHALRFEVNGPGESEDDFVARVNRQARDDDGTHPGTSGPGERWLIGEARNVGSIHSDIWKGRASDLADSNKIGVFPAVGWWRQRHHLNCWDRRCRYSLLVSIHTPDEEVDIYTPVAIQLRIPITVEVPTI